MKLNTVAMALGALAVGVEAQTTVAYVNSTAFPNLIAGFLHAPTTRSFTSQGFGHFILTCSSLL
jgi:hypothetical protein